MGICWIFWSWKLRRNFNYVTPKCWINFHFDDILLIWLVVSQSNCIIFPTKEENKKYWNHHLDNVYTGVPISYSLEIQSHSENGFMKPMLFGGDEGHPHSRSLTNILKIPRKNSRTFVTGCCGTDIFYYFLRPIRKRSRKTSTQRLDDAKRSI